MLGSGCGPGPRGGKGARPRARRDRTPGGDRPEEGDGAERAQGVRGCGTPSDSPIDML